MDIKTTNTKELQKLKKQIELELATRTDDSPVMNQDFVSASRAKMEQERAVEHAKIQKEWEDNPELEKAFLADIRQRNQDDVIEGFLEGWWELDDDGQMKAPPLVFKLSDFAEVKNPLMAHVMAKAEIFKSIGQARKNGWDKPLTIGEWSVTKKKIIIRVVK